MNIPSIITTKSYEKVIYILRRHGFTFFPYVLIFLALVLLPILAFWMFSSAFDNILIGTISLPVTVLLISSYYLFLILLFYTFFVEFYLDTWIVTNDRLVDVRQISLFARTVAEVDLYQIQDVSSKVHGFFPSIFNYGDVYLQTAGPIPKFVIYNVYNPDKLRQVIIELASEDKKFHAGK